MQSSMISPDRLLGHARAASAVRPGAGDRSPGDSCNSMVGEDLSRNRTDAPAIAGRGRIEDFGIMKECP